MMPSNAELIRALRSFAGHQVSISQCQKALGEAGNDLESAKTLLEERGLVEQRSRSRGMEKTIPEDAPEGWAYLLAKVNRYLQLGADIYRRDDALQMPDIAWDQECLDGVLSCFRQFSSGKGYRADNPIENVEISGFTAALKTLHFRKVKQLAILPEEESEQAGKTVFLDKILFEHLAVDMNLWLFNKVVYEDPA